MLFCETFTPETQQAPTTQLQAEFYEKHKQQTHGRPTSNRVVTYSPAPRRSYSSFGECWLPCAKSNLSCTFRQFPSSFHSLSDAAVGFYFFWDLLCMLIHRRDEGEEGTCVCPGTCPWGKEVEWGSCGLLDISLGGDG